MVAKFPAGQIAVDWIGFNHELKVHVAMGLADELEKLEGAGLRVFGLRRRVARNLTDESKVEMATIFVVPFDFSKIVRNEKVNTEVVPAVLRNYATQR